MREPRRRTRSVAWFATLFLRGLGRAIPAHAGGAAGDWVQSDLVGASVWSHNFDSGQTTTLADALGLSEFVGLHYYFLDNWRAGLSLQFTEAVTPAPPAGESRFSTFALLPQVGWIFHRPFFAQITFALPLREASKNQVDLGIQAVFGASLPLTPRLSGTLAIEIPYFFGIHRLLGATPLAGLGWTL